MAFIEKIEYKLLKESLKNKYTYILWLGFIASLFAFNITLANPIFIFLGFIFSLIIVIDIKHFLILDTLQIILFVIANILLNQTGLWQLGYMGATIGLILFGSIYFVYEKLLDKQALGFGDVKLFVTSGLFVGAFAFSYFLWILTALSFVVIIARLFIKDKNKLIPYGPIIVISIWICLIFEKQLFTIFYNFINNLYL